MKAALVAMVMLVVVGAGLKFHSEPPPPPPPPPMPGTAVLGDAVNDPVLRAKAQLLIRARLQR